MTTHQIINIKEARKQVIDYSEAYRKGNVTSEELIAVINRKRVLQEIEDEEEKMERENEQKGGYRYFCEESSKGVKYGRAAEVADEFSENVVFGIDRDRSNSEEELKEIKESLPKLRYVARKFRNEMRAKLPELDSEIRELQRIVNELKEMGHAHSYELKSLYKKKSYRRYLVDRYEGVCRVGSYYVTRINVLENRLARYEQDNTPDYDALMIEDGGYNTLHWNRCWELGEKTLEIVTNRIKKFQAKPRQQALKSLYSLNKRINRARMGIVSQRGTAKHTRVGNMPFYWYALCKVAIEGEIYTLNPNSRTKAHADKWIAISKKLANRPNKLSPVEEKEVQYDPDKRMTGDYALNEDALIRAIDMKKLASVYGITEYDLFLQREEQLQPEPSFDNNDVDIIDLYNECNGNVSAMARNLNQSWYLTKKRLIAALEDAVSYM